MQDFEFDLPADDDMPPQEPAKIIYYLYIIGPVFGLGVLLIPALVVAYAFQARDGSWIDSHYRFQIRTFWMSILYILIATVCLFILVGFLMYALIIVWWYIRSVKGLRAFYRREVHPDVTTWMW
ncbi:MAG: hypothetical protein OXC91_02835 [Rhodobacteraceae bacterium]|nr:hypothetical protein [Paracoccaceae bacterium]